MAQTEFVTAKDIMEELKIPESSLVLSKIQNLLNKIYKVFPYRKNTIINTINKIYSVDNDFNNIDDIYIYGKGDDYIKIDFKYTFWPKKLIEKKVFKMVDAYLVREGDTFSIEIDNGKTNLQHKLNPFNTNSNIIGSYARGVMYNGEVVIAMANKNELEAAKKSASLKARGKGTAWDVWFEEVAKKLPIKRLVKMMPIPDELKNADAIESENYASPEEMVQADKDTSVMKAVEELKQEVEKQEVVTLKDALEDMGVEYELKKGWVKVKKEHIPEYLVEDLKMFTKEGNEGFLIGKLLQEVKYSFEVDETITVEPIQ
jgi:hypothetical protein